MHCRAGVDRSAAVVTTYLMRAQGWSYREAHAFVLKLRDINIVPLYQQQVQQFMGEEDCVML